MYRFSLTKTRRIFIAFFLLLAVPSTILSFQAYQQLKWQSLHQTRQIGVELVKQIDNRLVAAIRKEEARTDTDYTFFVLAGSPEARFVQRSELSKFPVDSDIPGLVGYFQIDSEGQFSSPVLPSAAVQSEVVPSLYGIDHEENKQRLALENQLKLILKENRLVTELNDSPEPEADGLNFDDNNDERNRVMMSQSEQQESSTTSDNSVSSTVPPQSKPVIVVTGSRVKREADEKNAFYQAIEKKRRQSSQKKKQSVASLSEEIAATRTSRKARLEKNYSPQQSLSNSISKNDTVTDRIRPEQIKLDLFESEIEPIKFSLLESGHFVIYRQVWRNDSKIVQGAIVSAAAFVENAIISSFRQSSLTKISSVQIFFGDELIATDQGEVSDYSLSSSRDLNGESLLELSLSEPFAQISLDFKITDLPTPAGATFVVIVAIGLLLGLVLGTTFLYNLVLKQSYLVQQQQDFVSSVSHELKTPLTSIRMYGEILKQGWVTEEKRREYYDYIYSESERLSRLIANVLQISGMSRNSLELDLEPVTISELSNLIRSKVDSQLIQSGFELVMEEGRNTTNQSINVDKDAFIQIVINLVDNAIKYAVNATIRKIEIKLLVVSQDQIILSVRDYGPGIAKKDRKRVFDLFYRSGEEMTREVKGTGIGLALVKELVDAMSAKIRVDNCHPGAEFRVEFNSSN
ncbi:MAG: HAMP domain-containing histidine kinase [Kangiellaceae bacterium]|nr:HAMP domain-containing histidine kinase [Kangiellaceae bacterium]